MAFISVKRCVSLFFLGVLFSVLGTSYALADTIKLGFIADLTGPTNGIGASITVGFETYLKMINSEGGVNGNKLEVTMEDGKYNIPRELALYKKFREQGVFSVIYTWTTGSQVPLMKEYIKDKNIVFPTTRVSFLFSPVNPWIFITSPTYDTGYFGMVDYVSNKKGTKIAVVYPDNKYGEDAISHIKKRAAQKHIEVVPVILNLDAVDATSQVVTLKKSNVDYVMVALSGRATKTFLEAAQKLGLNTPLIGNPNTTEQILFELAGHLPIVKNLVGVTFYATPGENVPGMRKLIETAKKFGVSKDRYYDPWYMQGWTDAMVFVEGLKRAGKEPTTEKVKNAIENMKTFDTGGLTAPLSYSVDNHTGTNKIKFVKMNLEKGYWEPISGWVSPE